MRLAVRSVLLSVLIMYVTVAYASVSVSVNGTNYTIPQTNEKGWGTNVTTWIQAISANTLQPSGGTFSLTADANFGSSYGLVSTYFKSRSSNISTAGVYRLANTDTIGWRNNANDGNLLLSVDSSDRLLFNGVLLPSLATSEFTDTGFRVVDDGDSTKKIALEASGISPSTTRTLTMPDANVNLGALTNSNIDAAAGITYSKLNLSGGVVNADVNSSAAIAYSKLNLASSVVNADVASGAAIARNKLASGTASHVLINDGSGVMTSEATLAKSRGGAGADMSSVTFPSTGTITTDAGTSTLSNKTLTTPTTDVITLDDQGSTPSNPSSGFYKLYAKTDGKIYKLTPSGVESELGSGSSGSAGINILSASNPNAEVGATTNWTNTGSGTFTTTSTAANVGSGTYAFSFDASTSGDRVDSATVAIPAGLYGQNCLLFTRYKGFDSNITFSVTDGSSVLYSQALTAAATGYTPLYITFPCPSSGSLAMRVAATGNAAIGYFDDVYLGENYLLQNSPVITEWASYTPTLTGFGSATNIAFKSRRVGDSLEVVGQFTAGTTTGVTAQITLGYAGGNANVTIDSAKIAALNVIGPATQSSNNTVYFGAYAITPSPVAQNYVNLSVQTSTNNAVNAALGTQFATSAGVTVSFKVPISGWGSQAAVRADNADFDPVSWTPTLTGFGTATGVDFKYRRVGKYLEGQYFFTAGTTSAATASFTLPTGLVVDMSGSYVVGSGGSSATPFQHNVVVATSSSTTILYFTSGSAAALTGVNGNTWASSTSFSGTFKIPIVGWTNNQRAPLLVGSVTSNSGGLERIERLVVDPTCSSTPCTISSQSGSWATSVARSATGTYQVNVAAGIFSGRPVCTFASMGSGINVYNYSVNTTSQIFVATQNYSSALTDSGFSLVCMGPR